ncbi:uncharacterized protein BX664DRAFT_358406 [Halteromyces radiatus]|uniref:uncharacterized protein n=1 Tax=Halteromyces radiatus TaxID=101107 RepID=UPI00221FBD9C|nr:uncharacterized protein BX664DRAFT_358406 [Halteromyces radiatus]KAI8088762.1 hypothetical protein BX664DRAFT_358406 [Halteromyces radiatus]
MSLHVNNEMDHETTMEKGLVADIVTSIMTPGYTATGVIKAMFYAFYALFATLIVMVVITGGNGHVIALLLLAFCLFLAIRWFIAEMDNLKRQHDKSTTKSIKKKSKKKKKKHSRK